MNTRAFAFALGALALAGAGVFQSSCTTQTAIAIKTVEQSDGAAVEDARSGDAFAAQADSADDRAKPDTTAGDARIVLDGGATLLFFDSFDNGFAAKWSRVSASDGPIANALDGANSMVTLAGSDGSDSRLACNLDGEFFASTDISASMKVRIDGAPKSTRVVRLTVRQSSVTANIFYAVGVTVDTDGSMTKVSVFKKVPDNDNSYAEVEAAQSPKFAAPIPMGTWASMRLAINGTTNVTITATFEGQPGVSYTDDCKSDLRATDGKTIVRNGGCLLGQTGLGIDVEKSIMASVDDVFVTTP